MMKDLLGTTLGAAYGISVLALWVMLPLSLAVWIFRRKDL
jgi:ABC-type transport system involved in multi-copper enzyme maturation permease subunit